MNDAKQQIVVMTGATSGIGAEALTHLASDPDTLVIVGARGERTVPAGVELLPLDLASLDSAREFAAAVTERIGDASIDVLVLNAGVNAPNDKERTVDGFELMFATNHLSHYLLARTLLPRIADNGRVVITTSDTHDPRITPIAPKSLDPELLAHPVKSGAGVRAYAASKLCNIMTAQSLARDADVEARHIEVVAFNPGLVPGTGLGGESSMMGRIVITVLMNTVFRVVGWFKPEYVQGSADVSGAGLAKVARGELTPPSGKMYVSFVKGEPTFPDPSVLARDTAAQAELWDASAKMVGIAP